LSFPVLTDDDVTKSLRMSAAVACMEDTFRKQAAGILVAPARITSDLDDGQLVFTTGASKSNPAIVGFRAYDFKQLASPNRSEINAVFSAEDGSLRGLVIGTKLGAVRTGAIGGVAVKHLSNEDSRVLGMIGSGLQARTQLEAAVVVRAFETINVYSRNANRREHFAVEMSEKLGCKISSVHSAQAAVEDADVLICTTKSAVPVVEANWLKPGVHINNVGPKFTNNCEIGFDIAERAACLLTDTPVQMEIFGDQFILHGTPLAGAVVDLADVVAGKLSGRSSSDDITLFYSLGLAGTEVLLADCLFGLISNA